jgi:hypothetical protein
MEQFTEIIDTYLLNYDLYENGKVEFECDYGELIFFKGNRNMLTLFGIYIFPEHRKKGFCRNILQYLIDKSENKFKYVFVESVLSKVLYEYLLRFKYKNKKFKKITEGFIYKNFPV